MACGALSKKVVCAATTFSLFVSPVAASAQALPSQVNAAQVDPLVAFSLLGTTDSRVALCGLDSADDASQIAVTTASAATVATANATAANTATTTQADGTPGCVLPIRDAVVAPVQGAAAGYPGIPPLMLLAAGGALLYVIAILRDKGDGIVDLPISPA